MARNGLEIPPVGKEPPTISTTVPRNRPGTSWPNGGPTLWQSRNSQADLEDAARMAEVFKVLSDPTRVNMIQVLIRGEEMCVRDLADQVEMSQSSVSHHLRILRHFRLVRARRQGREVLYAPDDPHVEMLLRVCLDHLQEG